MLTSDEFFDMDDRTGKISEEIADLFNDLDIAEPVSFAAIDYVVNATLKILKRGA